jgi:GDP/UDP-N,N'-diacetylbacillosamine 2-epimerase (hydrolysing)
MIKKRKICVVTGTRAEYGLLYWLMKEISQDHFFEFQLVVTGMHLAPEFGLTYKQIRSDGFEINAKVEMLLSSDTSVGVSKSIGLGIIGFADVFEDLKPDIIVVLGDRSEIFAAVSAAMIARVPVAHIHGGETTEGAYDESMRHSITKMSHLHFTSTEIYRNRVIQLGEQPQYVFDVGAPGIDNIKRLKLMSRDEFEKSINFKLGKKNLLVTFHPVTLERSSAKKQFLDLLVALNELEDTYIIFTKANSDVDGRVINSMIDEYVQSNSDNSMAYTSLGQLRYLSAMQFVDGVVGNSSSGLIEAPSFYIGTINIGDRQKGRIKAASVIDCLPTYNSIKFALTELYSAEFNAKLKEVQNPYGEGGAVEKIISKLKSLSVDNLLKKQFYDM